MVSRTGDGKTLQPYSLRLSETGIRMLREEAAREMTAPRTLAQELIEEGLRMRRFPAITFAPRGGRRTAVFAGAPRLRVGAATETVRGSASLDEAAEYLGLSIPELEQALDYEGAYRPELERENEEHRAGSQGAYEAWLAREVAARRGGSSAAAPR